MKTYGSSVQLFQMGAKCQIVLFYVVGRTKNGAIDFSAYKIAVLFQFFSIDDFYFREKKTFEVQQIRCD